MRSDEWGPGAEPLKEVRRRSPQNEGLRPKLPMGPRGITPDRG